MRECRRLARTGTQFQRRYCVCEPDRLIEVGPEDPVAFYRACCWSPGETPEQARAECERRRQDGWCEASAPDDVLIATGPYNRRGEARLYESLEEHRYLIPSDIVVGEGMWVATDGEPPCFPHGTMIELEDGPRPIEDVRPGDRVVTSRPGEERTMAPVLDVKARTADVVLALELGDRELLVTRSIPSSWVILGSRPAPCAWTTCSWGSTSRSALPRCASTRASGRSARSGSGRRTASSRAGCWCTTT